jgi:hypothetical protein
MRCKRIADEMFEKYGRDEDDFLEERGEDFLDFARKSLDRLLKEYIETVDIDTLPTLSEFMQWLEDAPFYGEFEYKNYDTWRADEYESMIGDCMDRRYDEYKDSLLE